MTSPSALGHVVKLYDQLITYKFNTERALNIKETAMHHIQLLLNYTQHTDLMLTSSLFGEIRCSCGINIPLIRVSISARYDMLN